MDCAYECGGDAVEDNCGTCDSDLSNDCECDYFDSCGVCNGDNSDCWFIDISSSVGNLGIEDNLNRNVNLLCDWFVENELSIHFSKNNTKFIVLGTKWRLKDLETLDIRRGNIKI